MTGTTQYPLQDVLCIHYMFGSVATANHKGTRIDTGG